MIESFFERPILNSPYAYPGRHWELDDDGQPTNRIVDTRRRSELITPVPKPQRRRRAPGQTELGLGDVGGLTTPEQEYNPTPIINEIRGYVAAWRNLPNPNQWQVTPETARLLQHWRHHQFDTLRPFFCQIEAVETAIWLAEVASERAAAGSKIWTHIRGANQEANPELLRIALKLATGAGKTTVMAMLIAWQAVNAARHSGSHNILARLPGRHARHHDQGPAACAPVERSEQLLPRARTRAERHARRHRACQDRHHQLPRLPAARAHGGLESRTRIAQGPRP
jgi:type III restriction enzyme